MCWALKSTRWPVENKQHVINTHISQIDIASFAADIYSKMAQPEFCPTLVDFCSVIEKIIDDFVSGCVYSQAACITSRQMESDVEVHLGSKYIWALIVEIFYTAFRFIETCN